MDTTCKPAAPCCSSLQWKVPSPSQVTPSNEPMDGRGVEALTREGAGSIGGKVIAWPFICIVDRTLSKSSR